MDPTWWVREEEIPPLFFTARPNQVAGGAMIPREQQKEGSLKIVS